MIQEGAILDGPYWPEPIEIKSVEIIGDHVHLIGITINSNTLVDQILSHEDFEKLIKKGGKGKGGQIILDFSAPASEVFLSLEAKRYKFASMFDPFLAMNTSKIDPLPFQLDAVYLHILKNPKIRFMIADDPGAGKTIMAGLIIKELKLRGLAHRILIISPGHLKFQWVRELREKFQENFRIIDRAFVNINHSENPWESENQFIASIDFAKREDIIEMLKNVEWDLVIVDEAHKMAAYKFGKKTIKTKAYKLGEILSKTTENLIFLTATPHKGDPENFRLLLDLLVPGFFAESKMVAAARKDGDNPLFIRRIKEDLKDFDGNPIFTKRETNTVKFDFSDEELKLYNKLSNYIIFQYNKAISQDRRNFVFALLLLQRRMASSIFALLESLKRKRIKFEAILENPNLLTEYSSVDSKSKEDESEDERWKQELSWESATLSITLEELKDEIETLDELIEMAEMILASKEETKLSKLKEILTSLGDEKVLIFSEAKDSVDYLMNKISSWGYSVNTIHGNMNMHQRVTAEYVFKEKTQIMVATEAAGEGINLQFCHLMINYDIPWNPNRLEQRMGRIHRYKQKNDVVIFNLVAYNTREGKVLGRVLEKLEEIRKTIGTDKVFDVIGDVFQGKDLFQMVSDAVSGERSLDEIEEEINIPLDEEYKNALISELLDEGLVDSIDYKGINELSELTQESRLVPEYLEAFFQKALDKIGGKMSQRKIEGSYNIATVPAELRRIADSPKFKKEYGILLKSYPRLTFDKELASGNPELEYISFGHPLLESTIKWIEENYSQKTQTGCVFRDTEGKYNGIFWFFEGAVKDGNGYVVGKKLFVVYDNGVEQGLVNPSIIWDFEPIEYPKNSELELDKIDKNNAQTFVISEIEGYMGDLKTERERQAKIKQKYGIISLELFISDLELDLSTLYFRQEMGENVDLVIRNKEDKKKNYEIALEKLTDDIIKEKSLLMSMPKLVGAIHVLSEQMEKEEIQELSVIEQIGMDVVIKYEKSQNRHPKDVSKDKLGFDIKSKDDFNKIRYIEVKARNDEGLVKLSLNEWFKAKRFRNNYWLYVVANATEKPTLYVIQNPVYNLKAKQIHEINLIIYPEEWKKGEMVYIPNSDN